MATRGGPVAVTGLGHINLRGSAPLIERLRDFYRDVVGLTEGPRPTFRSGSRGYWMYAGERDMVHLTVDPHAEHTAPATGGALDHVAFACSGLPAALQRLHRLGIDFAMDRIDAPDQVQLFLTDPAGTGIELNFSGEAAPD